MVRGLDVDVRHRLSRLDLAVSLHVGPETLALVGPSGAGKTSLLRAVAGLLRPDHGRIWFDGQDWLDTGRGVDLAPERRAVGMVFQDFALFPHLRVLDNVAYGARARGLGRIEARTRAGHLLERFAVGRLAGARPRTLSGGERQRVALARAVAADPAVLLLDEPLAALDATTKGEVAGELLRHLRELRLPTLLVAHDFGDVVGMADRIAVIEAGRIVQAGTAAELLEAPASPFVAALTGVNYFRGRAVGRGDLTEIQPEEGEAVFLSTERASGRVGVVIYPWEVALSLSPPDGSARNMLAGPIRRVVPVGNRARVTVGSRPEVVAEITEESIRRLGLTPGVAVVATWKATGTRLVPGGPE